MNRTIELPPESLSPGAQHLWKLIVAKLDTERLKHPLLFDYLQAYCRFYEIQEMAYQDCLVEGKYVMEGENIHVDNEGNKTRSAGAKRISASYELFIDATNRMNMIGRQLGLAAADEACNSMPSAMSGDDHVGLFWKGRIMN